MSLEKENFYHMVVVHHDIVDQPIAEHLSFDTAEQLREHVRYLYGQNVQVFPYEGQPWRIRGKGTALKHLVEPDGDVTPLYQSKTSAEELLDTAGWLAVDRGRAPEAA